MIFLTPLQKKIYEAAKAAGAPITQDDLLKAVGGSKRYYFQRRLKVCIAKGYLQIDSAGAVTTCEPLHVRILRDVCKANGLWPELVSSSSKTMKLTRARRTVAIRLQRVNYSFADIAAVVNRHPSTVMDYLFADRAAARSRIRAAQLMKQRASA